MRVKDDIIKLRNEGYSYNEISKKLNCSKGTISFHCTKLESNTNTAAANREKRRLNLIQYTKEEFAYIQNNEEKRKTIEVLYSLGIWPREIASVVGISEKDLIKYVKVFRLKRKYTKLLGYSSVKRRFRRIKLLAVEYKGGGCSVCGYNKCITALDFHHLNPKEKDFNISGSEKHKWETIKEELDKCICICSNCHRELHAGLISLEESTNDKC